MVPGKSRRLQRWVSHLTPHLRVKRGIKERRGTLPYLHPTKYPPKYLDLMISSDPIRKGIASRDIKGRWRLGKVTSQEEANFIELN